MPEKIITSLQHPLVKHWAEIRKSRHGREKSQTALIFGEKAIREFTQPIRALITLAPSKWKAEEKYLVTEEILTKISGLKTPDGFAAEVEIPPPQDLSGKRFVLILDQLQDPGNVGTLLRSAFGLGWEAVIATPGTVDFFNDKALRGSQGAIFRLPYAYYTAEEIVLWAKRCGISLWIGDMEGEKLSAIRPTPPLALVLSHEGQGKRFWTQHAGKTVAIPMHCQLDSLNVASAGAILLYTLRESS